MHAMPASGTTLAERLAESARYALLRRLAPALRHNMAGSLQPIGMISAMLERRLREGSPDIGKLGKNARDIGELSREAATICLGVMSWLAPGGADTVALNSGLVEALQLQATELSFRGFTLLNETAEADMPVSRRALRSLTLASLMALTDEATGPARIVLSAHPLERETLLRIELVPTAGEAASSGLQVYRPLEWDDVQALADAEGLVFGHAENRVELRLPAVDAQVG